MSTIVPTNGQVATGGPVPMMPGMGGTSNGNMPAGSIPGTMPVANPTQIAQQNPMIPVGAVPTVNGLPPGSQQTNGINWNDGSNTVLGDMNDTYGKGTAGGIASVLQGLGTTNDAAIQATINNTNLEAGKQYANIQATQAASGITPDSSSAALAAGDFYSTVNSSLQATIAGMEQNQENTLLQTLLDTGSKHGPDVTGFQSFVDATSGILGLVSGGSQAASGITSAINPGADTSILDALGALAI